jgi:chromosome segregation ATPase
MHNELNNLNLKINTIQQNMNDSHGRIKQYDIQHNNLINQQINYVKNLEGLSKKLSDANTNYNNALNAKNNVNLNNYVTQVYHPATYTTAKVCNGHDSGRKIGGTRDSVMQSLQNQVSTNQIKDFNINYMRPITSTGQLKVIGNVQEYSYNIYHKNDDQNCNQHSNSQTLSSSSYYNSEITSESHRQYNEALRNADATITQSNQVKLNIAKEEQELRAKNEKKIIDKKIADLKELIKNDNDNIANYEKELRGLEQERSELKVKLENFQKQNEEILKNVEKIANEDDLKSEDGTGSVMSHDEFKERDKDVENIGEFNNDFEDFNIGFD